MASTLQARSTTTLLCFKQFQTYWRDTEKEDPLASLPDLTEPTTRAFLSSPSTGTSTRCATCKRTFIPELAHFAHCPKCWATKAKPAALVAFAGGTPYGSDKDSVASDDAYDVSLTAVASFLSAEEFSNLEY